MIHVCDDNRRINRDFYCSRELLLKHMTYFTPYLADERRFEEIDISVHCDVHIFEWLMEYIHQPAKPPLLDPGSVISVLISADFLQMRPLANHCIEYLRSTLPEVLRLPIDLSCVSDALLAQLAALLEPEDIEKLKDKKDKISSRLYAKKLEALLAQDANALHRCAFCTRLFTSSQREWEPCTRAPPLLDFHGNPIAEHVPNRTWDVNRWVASLRRAKGGAREAFWRLWGLTHFATCSTCDLAFPICELDRCLYHPQEAIFERGDHRGYYPCCGQQALRFEDTGSSNKRRGCLCRRHTPVTKPPIGCSSPQMEASARASMKLLETALSHYDLVLSTLDPSDGSGHANGAGASSAAGGGISVAERLKVAAAAAASSTTADDDDADVDDDLLALAAHPRVVAPMVALEAWLLALAARRKGLAVRMAASEASPLVLAVRPRVVAPMAAWAASRLGLAAHPRVVVLMVALEFGFWRGLLASLGRTARKRTCDVANLKLRCVRTATPSCTDFLDLQNIFGRSS